MIEIRKLDPSDITRLAEIHRAEEITLGYVQKGEELTEKEVDWKVPDWPVDGPDNFSVNGLIKSIKPYLAQGAVLLGALDGDRLAGIAVLRYKLTESVAQLALLHVSREYRRQGIGSLLTGEMIRLAREDGARQMYVSATPSQSAVGFYLSHGFRPTSAPIKELLDLEPDDIHMVKVL